MQFIMLALTWFLRFVHLFIYFFTAKLIKMVSLGVSRLVRRPLLLDFLPNL